MKIILATQIGSAQELYHAAGELQIAGALQRSGHQVEWVRLPFSNNSPEILEQILAYQLLDLSAYGDRLIALRAPAYFIQHPHKVVWFGEFLPEFYRAWNTPYQTGTITPALRRIRELLLNQDKKKLGAAHAVFATSRNAAAKLKQCHGINARVVYPAYPMEGGIPDGICGDYFLFYAPLEKLNRPLLAVESMRWVASPVKLVFCSPSPDPGLREQMEKMIRQYGLESKIKFLSPDCPEKEAGEIMAQCFGVLHIPFDENSVKAAWLAGRFKKMLLTCSDSGAPLEWLEPGQTGLAVKPVPEDIAKSLDRIYREQAAGKHMGERALAGQLRRKHDWNEVVERLLA
jgi:glycosyltransferase involved in cell wall biosynthesis